MLLPKNKTVLVVLFLVNFFQLGCVSQSDNQPSQDTAYGNVNLNRSAKYNVQLGVGYLEQGDVERAKEKLLKAVKQAPQMPEAHYNLAHFYYLVDDFELADQHFNEAIKYAYDNTSGVLGTAYNNYGVFLCQTSKYKKAYEQFDNAAADQSYADSASAYENAGLCALKAGDKALAKANFEKAVKQNPFTAKSLIELTQLSVVERNYKQAKIYLQRYNSTGATNKRSLLLNLEIAKSLGEHNEILNIKTTLREKFPEALQGNNEHELNPIKTSSNREKFTSLEGKEINYQELGKLNKIT